jgi:hypothetical protein
VPSPLAYWRERGIPGHVIDEAIDWCFWNCEPLSLARIYGMLQRRLYNWEAAQQRRLFERVKPRQQPQAYVPWLTRRVLAKESARLPGRRRPEERGFQIDHDEGRRWRRFRLSGTEERR